MGNCINKLNINKQSNIDIEISYNSRKQSAAINKNKNSINNDSNKLSSKSRLVHFKESILSEPISIKDTKSNNNPKFNLNSIEAGNKISFLNTKLITKDDNFNIPLAEIVQKIIYNLESSDLNIMFAEYDILKPMKKDNILHNNIINKNKNILLKNNIEVNKYLKNEDNFCNKNNNLESNSLNKSNIDNNKIESHNIIKNKNKNNDLNNKSNKYSQHNFLDDISSNANSLAKAYKEYYKEVLLKNYYNIILQVYYCKSIRNTNLLANSNLREFAIKFINYLEFKECKFFNYPIYWSINSKGTSIILAENAYISYDSYNICNLEYMYKLNEFDSLTSKLEFIKYIIECFIQIHSKGFIYNNLHLYNNILFDKSTKEIKLQLSKNLQISDVKYQEISLVLETNDNCELDTYYKLIFNREINWKYLEYQNTLGYFVNNNNLNLLQTIIDDVTAFSSPEELFNSELYTFEEEKLTIDIQNNLNINNNSKIEEDTSNIYNNKNLVQQNNNYHYNYYNDIWNIGLLISSIFNNKIYQYHKIKDWIKIYKKKQIPEELYYKTNNLYIQSFIIAILQVKSEERPNIYDIALAYNNLIKRLVYNNEIKYSSNLNIVFKQKLYLEFLHYFKQKHNIDVLSN